MAVATLAAAAPSALASDPVAVSTETGKEKATWTSPVGSGLNTSYFLAEGTCGALNDLRTACDKTIVRATGTVGEGSKLIFRIDGFKPVSDFDIRVYETDEAGGLGAYLGSPSSTDVGNSSPLKNRDPRYTGAGDYENKVVDISAYAEEDTGAVDQYFAVVVPYFLVANDSFKGHATLEATPFVAP